MADTTIGVVVDPSGAVIGTAVAKKSLSTLDGAANKLKGTLGEVSNLMKNGLGAVGAALGFNAVKTNVVEAERSLKKLEATLQATGNRIGFTVDQLSDMASELQRTSEFSDDAVMAAEAIILSFNKIGRDVFPRALQAAADWAAFSNTDIPQAAEVIARALQSPAEGVAGLNRTLRLFTDGQVKTLEQMVKTGRAADAQAAILAALEGRTKGAAAAMRDTLGGALKGAQNAFGDLLEGDGTGVKGATKALNDLTQTLQSEQLKNGFAALVAGMVTVMEKGAKFSSFIVDATQRVGEFFARLNSGRTDDALTQTVEKLNELKAQRNDSAMYFWLTPEARDELDKQIASLEKTVVDLNKMANSVDTVSVAQEKAVDTGKALNETLAETSSTAEASLKAAAEAMKAVADANRQRELIIGGDGVAGVSPEEAAYTVALERLDIEKKIAEVAKDTAKVQEVGAKRLQLEAEKALSDLKDELANNRRLEDAADILDLMKQGVEQEKAAYAIQLKRLEADGKFAEARALRAEQAIEEEGKAMAAANALWQEQKRQAEELGQTLTDALLRAFEQGKGFAKAFVDTLKNMFQTLVLKPLVQAIVQPVANALNAVFAQIGSAAASSLGIQTATSAAGAGAGAAAGKGVLAGAGAYGASYAQGALGAYYGVGTGLASNATAFNAGANFAGSGAGSLVGGATGAVVGYATSQLVRKDSNVDRNLYGAAAGAAAATGPVGLVVAGVLAAMAGVDRLANGGLFGTKFSTIAQKLNVEFTDGLADATLETIQKRKKSLFRGNKYRSVFDDAIQFDEILSEAFGQVFEGISGTAEKLGIVVGDFKASISRDLSGLDSAGVERELTAAISEAAGMLAEQLIPNIRDFQVEGEQLADTFNRVTTQAIAFSDIVEAIGGNLAETLPTGVEAVNLVQQLSGLAGGFDNLSGATSNFYSKFFSEAEQAAFAAKTLAEAIAEMGEQVPLTRDGFKELVRSMSFGDVTQQRTAVRLLGLADLADQVYSAIEEEQKGVGSTQQKINTDIAAQQKQAYSQQISNIKAQQDALRKQASAIQQNSNKWEQLYDSLNDFAKEILATTRTSGSNRAALQSQFDSLAARARLGDAEAASMLPEVGKDLVKAIEETSHSREGMELALEDIYQKTVLAAETAGRQKDLAELQLQALNDQIEQLDVQAELLQVQIDSLERVGELVQGTTEAVNAMGTSISAQLSSVSSAILAAASARNQPTSAGGGAYSGPIYDSNGNPAGSTKPLILSDSAVSDLSGVTYGPSLSLASAEAKAIQAAVNAANGFAGPTGSGNYSRINPAPIQGYAEGGYHMGGLRIVGEKGMELEATGPARYYNNSQMRRMLAGANDSNATDMELARNQNIIMLKMARDIAKLTKLVDRVIPEGDAVRTREATT